MGIPQKCPGLDADGQNNSGRLEQPVTIEVEEHPWAPYMRRTEPSDLRFSAYVDSDRQNFQRLGCADLGHVIAPSRGSSSGDLGHVIAPNGG